MPKLKKIFFNFALIFSMLFLINLNLNLSYALEIPSECLLDGGFDLLPDNNGNFFILSYDKNSTKSTLAYLDNTNESPSIKQLKFFDNGEHDSLGYKYTTANYCNGSLYLTRIDGASTIIEQYGISLNKWLCVSQNSSTINEIKVESSKQIAFDNNGNFFILSNGSADSITIHISGQPSEDKLAQSGKTFHAIATDTSKNYLYALDNSNNMLRYDINSGNYTFETSEITTSSFKFLADNIFVTSDGYICTLDNSNFSIESKVKISTEIKDYPACVTIGFDNASILAKTDDKTISRIRCSDGLVTGKVDLDENISALSISGEKIIALTEGKNVCTISESDITEIKPPESGDTDEGKGESGGGSQGDDTPEEKPSDETDDNSITSDIHHIDIENHTISEIPAGTTFSEFKNNLIFNGYNLVFRDTNNNVKTGNSTKIGTGYTVTFIKDGTEKVSFKLIVQGDITGTGSLTSRDISAFVNYLLGKASLDDTYLQAANINDDGEPDVIDLFLMYKLLQK